LKRERGSCRSARDDGHVQLGSDLRVQPHGDLVGADVS
jgi:hypothetical protein